MADDHLFLLPIVIDDTDQALARVPEKFLAVQWLKVPGGRPTPALESLCRRLASGNIEAPQPARTASGRPGKARSAPPPRGPEFPREEPGQRVRFWIEVIVWAWRSVWVRFMRLPRWLRIVAYVWLGVALITRCQSSGHHDSADLPPAKAARLKALSEKYPGMSKSELAKLGTEIATSLSDDADTGAADGSPLLAIPFTAPAGDAAAEKLADSAFVMAYGRVSKSHQGQVSLTKDPLPSRELGAALERGRANHSTYVLCGAVDAVDGAQALTVRIAKVADGSVIWSKTYPAAGADPVKIAAEVDGKIPSLAP